MDMASILHKFRSAVVGGFNRQDVMEYIEHAARESGDRIGTLTARLKKAEQEKAALVSELNSLRSQSGNLAEQEARIRASLEESTRSLTAVRGELQATRTQLAVAKNELAVLQAKVAEIEPEARRYEALKDRIATVELDAHQKAQATIDKAQEEVNALRADTAKWMADVQIGYDRLRQQVRVTAETAARTEDYFASLEDDYQQLLQRGMGKTEE